VSAVVGVVVFPGTNCELDIVWAVEQLGGEARLLWHGDATVGGVDAVVVPGGFAPPGLWADADPLEDPPGSRPGARGLSGVSSLNTSGTAASSKIACQGHSGSQAPQSMHSSGSI
jgi:hypothetical protein